MLTFVPILFNTSSPNTKAGSIEIAQSLFKKMIIFCVLYQYTVGRWVNFV